MAEPQSKHAYTIIRNAEGLRFCPRCYEIGEDCWWHDHAFSNPMSGPAGYCNACWHEAYPRRWVECVVCGEKMETHGHNGEPMHRKCKAKSSLPPLDLN